MTADLSALIARLEAGPQSGCAELPGWEELCAEAAAALRDLTEWRDIATAPKNTKVMMFYPGHDMDATYWLPLPTPPNQAKGETK